MCVCWRIVQTLFLFSEHARAADYRGWRASDINFVQILFFHESIQLSFRQVFFLIHKPMTF